MKIGYFNSKEIKKIENRCNDFSIKWQKTFSQENSM